MTDHYKGQEEEQDVEILNLLHMFGNQVWHKEKQRQHNVIL